jgi:hypothetical protein
VSQHTQVNGTLPASGTVLIAKGAPTPAGSAAETETAGTTTSASNQLPKTATGWPLAGVLGLLFVVSSFGMALLRRGFGFQSVSRF